MEDSQALYSKPGLMVGLRSYLLKNFEQVFILLIIVSVALITYFVPYKLTFLNFYFIPVLLAAYYLDLRKVLLGALFCILMVSIYALLYPEGFFPGATLLDLWMNLVTWGGFLILTGGVVGNLTRKLKNEIEHTLGLNKELLESKTRLEQADEELREHATQLEAKVAERTETLEKSKLAIEDLKRKVEEALYSTMDSSVVKLMIEKRLRTEKREISVLFSDLKQFTQYSEDSRPEVVITDLNRYFREMESVLLEYRGHIDKYMGDGIMAEFGAPVDYERHALMAVVAGLKMQERMSKANFPWQMRIGIARGRPIVGLIGHHRQNYTAIGDTVNLAARIQQAGQAGIVTIGEQAYEAVKLFIDARKKIVLPFRRAEDTKFVTDLSEHLLYLESNPKDVDALKKVAFLLLEVNDQVQAHDFLRRALELDPRDDQVKVAFAETSIKLEKMEAIAVKGKRIRLHLYEVIGLKDPLKDREKIPQKTYDAYHERVSRLVEHPEDIILPVEVVDGTVGHSRVVGFLSYVIADMLGLSDHEKKNILQAGHLIDIGKTIIPHHLLNRAGSLDRLEFEEVMKHSREGVRILRKMGYENEALFEIIECHHEDFNGSGYPSGLRGEQISIGARICAVADAYDSLTSWRPYRDRWEYRSAFSELEKLKGAKFDPKVLACLGKLLDIVS